jgi:hypothetical protein
MKVCTVQNPTPEFYTDTLIILHPSSRGILGTSERNFREGKGNKCGFRTQPLFPVISQDYKELVATV